MGVGFERGVLGREAPWGDRMVPDTAGREYAGPLGVHWRGKLVGLA